MPVNKRQKQRRQDITISEDETSAYEDSAASEDESDEGSSTGRHRHDDDAGAKLTKGSHKRRGASSQSRSKAEKVPGKPIIMSRSIFDKNGHRLTERGGYSHRASSKLKISMSNKGKTPWNKDKQRTGTDKAKISAGVKARNRAILLQQLEEWDMSENEYLELKKKTKQVRERLRRTKAINASKTKNDKVKLEPESGSESDEEEKEADEPEKEQVEEEKFGSNHFQQDEALEARLQEVADIHKDDEADDGPAKTPPNDNLDKDHEGMAKATHGLWAPHPFDSVDPNTLAQACPEGGPGGLICCSTCTGKFSQYLSSTYASMQEHSINLMGNEVQELGSLLKQASSILDHNLPGAAPVARRKRKVQ